MRVGAPMTPGDDKGIRIGMMCVRLGFALAFLMGLGMMLSIGPGPALLPVHVGAGVLVLGGSAVMYGRVKSQGYDFARQTGIVLLAFAIGAGNGILALLGYGSSLLHLALMILSMIAAESTMARLKRG